MLLSLAPVLASKIVGDARVAVDRLSSERLFSATTRLVDAQSATVVILSMERVDRRGRTDGVHLDESESTRPTGLPIVDEVHAVHCAVLLEERANLALGGRVG
jgi:hypothetical protein